MLSSLLTTVKGGKNYDNGLHNECVPLAMSKTTGLQMKCVLHLC